MAHMITALPSIADVLSSNVQRLMAENDWNQKDLAAQLAWPANRVSELLAGRYGKTHSVIEELAKVFHVDYVELVKFDHVA